VTLILKGLGVDPDDHNFDRTPQRVADVYEEMFRPPDTGYPVFDEKYTDMVVLKGHDFYTLCPHHLLPVYIKCSVGYMPNGKVIGASKLMRMVADANRMPLTQEALTAMILERIDHLTAGTSKGAAIILEGEHGCFKMRGVKSHAAKMVTMKFSGSFCDSIPLQRQFATLGRW
jgi:GTP cyclohydrolase I